MKQFMDNILGIEQPAFADFIHELEDEVGFEFMCIKCVRKALVQRIGAFFETGCQVDAQVMGNVPHVEASVEELTGIFKKGMAGEKLTQREVDAYKADLLQTCAQEYAKRA